MWVPFSLVIIVDSIGFVLHDLGRLRKDFHTTAATLTSTEVDLNNIAITGENITNI